MMRAACFLLALAALAGCRSRTGAERTDSPELPTVTGDNAAAGTLKAQCQILRRLTLFEGPRDIYLLNVCPTDEELAAWKLSINIALPGEPAVTTYFDTLRSFPDEPSALRYARENGLFDVFLDEPAGY
jgi:hypothetical protein